MAQVKASAPTDWFAFWGLTLRSEARVGSWALFRIPYLLTGYLAKSHPYFKNTTKVLPYSDNVLGFHTAPKTVS